MFISVPTNFARATLQCNSFSHLVYSSTPKLLKKKNGLFLEATFTNDGREPFLSSSVMPGTGLKRGGVGVKMPSGSLWPCSPCLGDRPVHLGHT